jgi:hypothetical protein
VSRAIPVQNAPSVGGLALALALALCGARVKDGMSWVDMRDALVVAELDFLDHEYGSVTKSPQNCLSTAPICCCKCGKPAM